MTVGKPDFNLNSFGVKYLSKDEVQEFLEKRGGDKIGTQVEVPNKLTPQGNKTSRTGSSDSSSTSGIGHKASNSLFGQARERVGEGSGSGTIGRKFTEHTPEPIKATGGTKTQFMSKEPPSPNVSNRERHLRADMESSGTKVDTSGIVTQKIKPLNKKPIGNDEEPKPKTEHIGSLVGNRGTDKIEGMDSKGKKRSISGKELVEPKERESQSTTSNTGRNLPKHVGDAPEGVESKTEKVGGTNVKVGVGEKANEKFKEDPVGEWTESQKPVDPNKKDGRVKGLNDQHPQSKGTRAHNKRGKANSKWYNDDQKAEYGKIDPKDRDAQAKYHTSQEKKYGKSVDTPKKLSAAGQKIKDKLDGNKKKANNIIMDMAIMKLDLMKSAEIDDGDWDDHDDDHGIDYDSIVEDMQNQHETNQTEAQRMNFLKPSNPTKGVPTALPKKLAKSAAETVFKAISLKLDLMKDVKSKRHNYTKLTSAGKNPAKKSPNASEALGAAYASGKMTENSVDADTNTETGATGKPKGSVADQYT